MSKKVVTIYINDANLKILVAKGDKVKKYGTLPLESGLVKDGTVIDEAKVAVKIRKLRKATRVRARKVIVGLSGLHCLCQLITLPNLPKEMLPEAIRREAERVLSVPLDELYISWQIIPASGEEISVFLAALPRNATDALVKTLRQAHVKPYLMDLAPLALARVVDRKTAAIVDIRSAEVDIVIMVEGVPQIVRSLSLPSRAVSLQEKLPTIREELSRTIKFYNSGHPEKPLESSLPIFVSGELAQEPEARQSLADELKHAILPLSSPLKCPKGLDPSQYMVNIGLALKELSPKKRASLSVVNLNVLPETYRPVVFSLSRVLIPLIITLGIGSLFPLAMLAQGAVGDTASLQAQVDFANQLLEVRQEKQQIQGEEITELQKQIDELEVANDSFTSVLNNFGRQQVIVNGDLESAISISTLPSTVDLSIISHASTELVISGMSPSETEVLEYASALRDTGRFPQVIITSIGKTESGVNFTLTLSARR